MRDWDLYRHFLAVARVGTLSAAARELGDSQPTVGRRIDDLERRLGLRLFTRTKRGFTPTAAGDSLLEVAVRMEKEVENAGRLARGSTGGIEGRVRLSASEGMGITWVIPHLAALERQHPGLRIELRIDNSPLDLSRGHADVALRLNPADRADLIGRRVGSLAFGLYASPQYLDAHGRPRTAADLRRHRVVLPTGAVARNPLFAWYVDLVAAADEAFACDSLLGLMAAARAGFGVTVVATVVAGQAGLERVLPRLGQTADLWVVTHRDLRRVPRVRAIVEHLARAAREDRARLDDGATRPASKRKRSPRARRRGAR